MMTINSLDNMVCVVIESDQYLCRVDRRAVGWAGIPNLSVLITLEE